MNAGTLGYPRGNDVANDADHRDAGILGGLEYWHAAGQINSGALTTFSNTTNALRLILIEPFRRRFRLAGVGLETTAGGVGSVSRLGVYRSRDAAEIAPRDLLYDSGSFSTVGATATRFSVDIPVTPGFAYWMGVLSGTAAPTCRGTVVGNTRPLGHGSGFGATIYNHLTRTVAFGALPPRLENNTASIVAGTGTLPLLYYRLDLPQGRVE